jgi:hypothetical protein
MSERTPAEIAAISRLHKAFLGAIAEAGVSRDTALDALEYTLDLLLVECLSSEDELDQYLDIMRDRVFTHLSR